MEYTEIQKIIENAKTEYKNIGKVFCPYLNQEVWFTMKGFRHLISNNRKQRHDDVILDRLSAIKYIPDIVSKSGTLQEYENINTEYFGFIAIIDSKKYKVILLKNEAGRYMFISVIPKYKTGIRDENQKPTQEE